MRRVCARAPLSPPSTQALTLRGSLHLRHMPLAQHGRPVARLLKQRPQQAVLRRNVRVLFVLGDAVGVRIASAQESATVERGLLSGARLTTEG